MCLQRHEIPLNKPGWKHQTEPEILAPEFHEEFGTRAEHFQDGSGSSAILQGQVPLCLPVLNIGSTVELLDATLPEDPLPSQDVQSISRPAPACSHLRPSTLSIFQVAGERTRSCATAGQPHLTLRRLSAHADAYFVGAIRRTSACKVVADLDKFEKAHPEAKDGREGWASLLRGAREQVKSDTFFCRLWSRHEVMPLNLLQ